MSILANIKNLSKFVENSNYAALSLIIFIFYILGHFFLPVILYSSIEWNTGLESASLWEIIILGYNILFFICSLASIIMMYLSCGDHIKNCPDDSIKNKYLTARKICITFILIFFLYYLIWISYFATCDISNKCFIEDSGATLGYSIVFLVIAVLFTFIGLGLFKLIFSSNKIPEHLKRKVYVVLLGASGSAAAFFAPIILAYFQQGSVDFDITAGRALFYLGVSFAMGLGILLSPKIRTESPDYALAAIMLGLAMPSVCLNILGGSQIHELQPKGSNGVNVEKVQGGRILQLKTSSIYQAPSKNLKIPFISTAYAEEHTTDVDEVPLDSDSGNDLNSNLNKPFNTAARFTNFLTSDIVNNLGKKYIISIAEFNTEDEAFTYYTKCIQEGYSITNSYVLELIPDSNYRVIFPSLDDKLSRGEANYKLYLLSENMKKEGDCLKTELSILEFE